MQRGKRAREEDDGDYVQPGENKRSKAPTPMFNAVYKTPAIDVSHLAGNGAVPANAYWSVPCQEGCGQPVYMDQSWKEVGKQRRPPLCHDVPDAHIIGALRQHAGLRPPYTGPNPGTDPYIALQKELEWDPANIHAGHDACNSPLGGHGITTWANASKARRTIAINYVLGRLRAKGFWP